MLTGKQRRHLRALAHHLKPTVMVGKEQMSEGVIAATSAALWDHELIKVKLGESAIGEMDRQTLGSELAKRTSANLIGIVGNIIVLYRANPEQPVIELPRDKAGKRAPGAPAESDAALDDDEDGEDDDRDTDDGDDA